VILDLSKVNTLYKVRNRSRFGINKWYQSLALRNFDLEDMELESTNSGPTAKIPILKLGEYEMWAVRIKQYFQIQDYALWEVIENGDSWYNTLCFQVIDDVNKSAMYLLYCTCLLEIVNARLNRVRQKLAFNVNGH
ncbi:hypothetical protein Tco_1382648, partial [Tanacetum coccineum]